MESAVCSLCQKPQAAYTCGLCEKPTCKKCSEKLRENQFSLMESVPAALSHTRYCGRCFDSAVAPALQDYEAAVEKARVVFVYYRGQGQETRLMKRIHPPIHVEGISDRSDVLMRLAFLAVRAGFNTLVDVEILPQKIRQGSYQTTSWSGRGIPTYEDPEKIHYREANRASR